MKLSDRKKHLLYVLILFAPLFFYFIVNVLFFPINLQESLFLLMPFVLGLFSMWVIVFLFLHRKFNRDKNQPHKVVLGLLGITFFYFFAFRQIHSLSDYIAFKFKENELNMFVHEIKSYPNIREVSTSQSYHGDSVSEQRSIDLEKYESFRKRLVQLDFIDFGNDGDYIYFTIDGFLDDCSGLAYSESGIQPASNSCGDVVAWRRISGNWYFWGTT